MLRAARLAFAIAGGGLGLVGCTTSGQPVLGFVGGPLPRTVAFDRIDGLPEQLRPKLDTQLGEAARARQVATVSRESPAQYRIRGYVAAHVQGKKTTITWVWDVFTADRELAVRLAGEVQGAPSERAWAAANDAVVTRIAQDGMDRLAAFLASPGTAPPGEFSPPREEASRNVASVPEVAGSLAFLPQSRP